MVTINTTHNSKISGNAADFDIEAWLISLSAYHSTRDLQKLRQVYSLMDGVIEHQQDVLGDTEMSRALKIAVILGELQMDIGTLLVSLLQPLVSIGVISTEQIEFEYGSDVVNLLNGINRMRIVDAYQIHSASDGQDKKSIERIRKLLLALAEDIRVVIMKIAERLYIMREVKKLGEQIRRQISQETMDIFAPLASRLGIWQVKWELEDLSFRFLHPETYQQIAKMLDERRIDREKYINDLLNDLRRDIKKAGISAEVTGRPKHIYSIWRKMKTKDVEFNELFDVRAARVLVNNIADCYAVLGIVHNKWRPIRSEFDDYIATPKENDYQSLHTAVIGPDNKTLEVQIRTRDMHEHAEYGVASHWGYKEGGRFDTRFFEKIAWVRQLLELRDEEDSGDLIEQFKSEIFEDRVYVLTPKGKVVDLPKGSTPLDFAYQIHTEIGHHFRGAKVDGKIVPIGYELKNGEQVEILTSKHSKPSRDWLNPHLGYLKSPRTRSKVRAWFKQQDFGRNVEEGREILERELHRLGIHDVQYDQIAKQFKLANSDELLAALGRGDITTNQIAINLNAIVLPVGTEQVDQGFSVPDVIVKPSPQKDEHIQILGVGELMSQLANCCKPVPPDPIIGYITRGRGVTVHRRDCANVMHLQEDEVERIIDVEWGESHARKTYPVDIFIRAFDRQGLLRDITSILTNGHLNVIAASTQTDKNSYQALITFTLEVTDLDQLSIALTKIEQLPNIMEVSRKRA